MPRKIDINSHSNQTPLKHAPVEWNFLLNKVLLTQLPAPRARAELSSSSLSTLMNPLKYRLIGIAALAQADPVTPSSSGLLGPRRLETLSSIFPDSHPSPLTKQLDTSWSEDEEMAKGIRRGKLFFLFCSFFLTRLQFAGLLRMGQKEDEPSQEGRGVALPLITAPSTTQTRL